MVIDIESLVTEAESEGITVTYQDVGANLLQLLLDNQRSSHLLTNYNNPNKNIRLFNEDSLRTSAHKFFNKDRSKWLQNKLLPIATEIVKDFKERHLEREDLKKTLQRGNEVEYKGLTANKIKAILEALVSKGLDSNDTKEVLDTLKLYVSKFDLSEEDKAKCKLINIEHKETKICQKCGSEIA